jgi:serine/threonine protein kinase
MLGAYKLIARIGAGGMGEVWKAEDTRLGRLVAVKILPQQIASDTEAIARMRREARTAAQLYHPNVATIHSFEEAEGRTFIVMELVDGEPLTALIARGALPEADVCRIGRGVAEALAEAHEHGIVHRDIKPDNIIVRGPRVKVLDFGIAKRVGVETASSTDPTAFVTQQGMILGTIHYMSPEQALGKQLDARTDIFSLGVVLYQAATGSLPFQGETLTDTMTQIIRDEPPPARTANPSISSGLAALIDRCMKKNRDDRFGSAADLSKELERLTAIAPTEPMTAKTVRRSAPASPTVVTSATTPPQRRHVWPLIAMLFALIAVAAVVYALHPWKNDAAPTQPPLLQARAAVAAPATASVSVVEPAPATATEPPAPAIKPTSTIASTTTASEPRHPGTSQPVQEPQPEPRPAANPKEQLRLGELALFRRNMRAAEQHFARALADPDQLDAHDRAFANLGLAIARGDRAEAVRIAREIRRDNPGDPDLAALHREFGNGFGKSDEPPRNFPRRRWPR